MYKHHDMTAHELEAKIARWRATIAHKASRGRALLPDPEEMARAGTLQKFYRQCETTAGFTSHFWPVVEPDRRFVPGWHIGCVGEHLDEVSRVGGSIQNLIINVPPRTMKSLLTCVFWFAKTWTHRPGSRWMFASFGGDLVQRDSMRCREIIQTPLYSRLWDVRVKPSQDTQLRYTNTHQGFRYSVTVNGQGMGEGADFLVIDDPQNPRRAASAVERENTIRWYRATFSRRVNDELTGRRVIIMQRLNERDLTGFLIAEQMGWEHLVLPMRYEPRRYWYGAGMGPPPSMCPEKELADGAVVLLNAAASPQPVEPGEDAGTPDQFTLPVVPSDTARPEVKRDSLVESFLKALGAARLADPDGEAVQPAGVVEGPPSEAAEALAKVMGPPEKAAEEEKAPRDSIRPTSLQLARPHLLDGPAGSGRVADGDLLWPERFPEAAVAKAEEELGPEAPGQYAQRPTGEGGDIFQAEHFRRFEPVWEPVTDPRTGVERQVFGRVRLYGPDADGGQVREYRAEHCLWFQTIDTALTEKSRSAYTAVLTFGVTPAYDLILWHVFRGKLNVQYQYPLIKSLKRGPVHWNQKRHVISPAGVWPFRVSVQGIENKASGVGIIQEAAADGNPLHPMKADTDKVTRAVPVSGMYLAGKVYHPHQGPKWLTEFEAELLQFPNGAYKDAADCMAHAGVLVNQDKLIRGLVAQRIMAEGGAPGADDARPAKVFTAGGEHEVEWPDDEAPAKVPPGFGNYGAMLDSLFPPE